MSSEPALKRTGRTRMRPPADAAQRITELAAAGWSIIGIAQQLGVGRRTLDKWRAEYPELEEAYRSGLEHERYTMHSALVEQARKGNTTAMIFLLKARHGYREGEPVDQSAKVAVQINLPASLPLEQFKMLTAPAVPAEPNPTRISR